MSEGGKTTRGAPSGKDKKACKSQILCGKRGSEGGGPEDKRVFRPKAECCGKGPVGEKIIFQENDPCIDSRNDTGI